MRETDSHAPSRILLLTDSFGGGGVERQITYLVRSLQDQGYQVSVRSFLNTQNRQDFPVNIVGASLLDGKKSLAQTQLSRTILKTLTRVLNFGRFNEKTFRLLNNYHVACHSLHEIIQTEEPKVILTFRRHAALIALITRKLHRLRVRIYCSHRSHLSKRIKKMPNWRLFLFLARRFYPGADYHVAVSNGVRKDIIDHFHVPQSKISTIYNAVDLSFVRMKADEPVENEFQGKLLDSPGLKIINIARVSETKGHDRLLKAFQQVRNKVACTLVIVGDGENRPAMELLAKELKIEESVFFLGWQKNPFQLLRNCDVFVSSSIGDGFSNVLLEAMALGLPIIATDCDFGPRELLDNGKFGILVPINDINALSEAMLRVLTDSRLRSEMRSLSAERIRVFEITDMFEKYGQLLKQGRI